MLLNLLRFYLRRKRSFYLTVIAITGSHTHTKKSQGSDNFHRYLSLQRKLEIKALPSFKEKDFSNDTLHFFYFSTGEVFA